MQTKQVYHKLYLVPFSVHPVVYAGSMVTLRRRLEDCFFGNHGGTSSGYICLWTFGRFFSLEVAYSDDDCELPFDDIEFAQYFGSSSIAVFIYFFVPNDDLSDSFWTRNIFIKW